MILNLNICHALTKKNTINMLNIATQHIRKHITTNQTDYYKEEKTASNKTCKERLQNKPNMAKRLKQTWKTIY